MKKTTTRAVVADAQPIDLDAWVRLFVAELLKLEQVKDVAPPPAVRLG